MNFKISPIFYSIHLETIKEKPSLVSNGKFHGQSPIESKTDYTGKHNARTSNTINSDRISLLDGLAIIFVEVLDI